MGWVLLVLQFLEAKGWTKLHFDILSKSEHFI